MLVSNSGSGNNTYVGSTNDFRRRLRQHNGEISGGARTTKPRSRRPWALELIIYGFETLSEARSFEWRWKHPPKGLFERGARPKSSKELRKATGIELAKLAGLKWRDFGTETS